MNKPKNVFISYSSLADRTMIPHGYSGIRIDKYWTLTHGSVLAPILSRSRKFLNFITNLSPGHLIVTGKVECDIEDLIFRVHRNNLTVIPGKLAAVWKCPLLNETLENSFKYWDFENQHGFDRLLMPIFLLIKCDSLESANERKEKCKQHWPSLQKDGKQDLQAEDTVKIEQILFMFAKQIANNKLTKGAIVELISTPFGNFFFADSLSRGIIGNLFGIDECLILLDMTTFPGCEGSPVYLINNRGQRNICGMVIASFSWCRGEWINCTFAVNLLPSCKLILQSRILKDESRFLACVVAPFTKRNHLAIHSLEKSVAVVKCGPNWGTCVLLDEQTRTFITCAHVVTKAAERRIEIVRYITSRKGKLEWFLEANLIYKTADNKPYDIAVLRVDSKLTMPGMKAIRFADTPVQQGEQILSIGFPFSSKDKPTITRGIVSKASNYMFQTNCCIQSGVSGGPIVRYRNFEMLGIIVCNVVATNNSISYPRLGMAIPITVLKEPLSDYLRTNDSKTLQKLTQHDADVVNIWNLRPFLPSNM